MTTTETPRDTHTLLQLMPGVLAYKDELNALNKQWIRTTLTGKINSNRVAATLIDFMEGTQSKFLILQDKLIAALAEENSKKTALAMAGMSQVAIDILKRNLFERTADVGFLATDDDIVEFLRLPEPDADGVRRMEARLRAYRDKYTVYDEIVILDTEGRIRAHLDKTADVRRSADPLLAEALSRDGYLETFRPSDIRPGKGAALLYSHRILRPDTGEALGVLCLSFDFTGEMAGIATNLLRDLKAVLCILDDRGKVISTSDPGRIPPGATLPMALDRQFALANIRGRQYLAKTARTNGYQGFVGLPWFGHILFPVDTAFGDNDDSGPGERAGPDNGQDAGFLSGALKEIDDDADDILSDLGLVVLNGEVMAAKQIVNADPVIRQEANALPPVLGAIHQVGEKIRGVFAESILSLQETVRSSRLDDARFLASLAIDIMDRNLYERANDCRWWALNSTFRRTLAAAGRPTEEDRRRLHDILAYINALYTVYSTLILYDAHGTVVAVSDPEASGLVGRELPGCYVKDCLRLRDPQQYCVSDFDACGEYAGKDGMTRHTYIYNAAVLHPDESGTAVGGIAIVFDSQPQFRAMLEDALPRDEDGNVSDGCSAFFVDRDRRIISSTDEAWKVGETLTLGDFRLELENGEQRSDIVTVDGVRRIVGCAMSSGYREYKRDGIYANDVAAVVVIDV
ncbi:CheW protein [Solidesulfovibrio fructosivorans JJ]]|uniref:CheW protein n=1 Tax=Solidesulfovibrio fructosivorans JJ] TaxID=596151 RepID=E1K0P5_SOLFR|nr:cache domain-containing protein [Solidesulfovibrio fructosivorans]EFL49809.1 CheW protein [Solidesulfovibrio fructosivorans JJ]]